jgi:hypothetical protein
MINSTLTTINSYLQGFDKLYCLLERREKKTVEYSGGGSYGSIPFDNYAVGGYWRMRSAVTVAESEGTVACTKRQVMTYPMYFVAWFNRDHVTETIDEFAQNTMALISGLRTPAIKTRVLGYDTEKQKEESGQISNTWVMIRFNVDVVYTKNCPTTCVTPVIDECILNGSINDVAIGQFFEDFNIIVVDQDNNEVGSWDEENSVWVVNTGGVCPEPCEVISEATAQEIVDCLGDGVLPELQDLICETPEPCLDVNVTVNGDQTQAFTSLDTCPLEIGFDVIDQDENELEATWNEVGNLEVTIVPPVCDPAIVNLEGVQIASIRNPCGSLTELTCDTVTNAVLVSGAGSDVNGLYILGTDLINGKIWWENTTTNTIIRWGGSDWQILNDDFTLRYYVDGGADWPWLGTWVVSTSGEEPVPTVTQATISDLCECSPCPLTITFKGREIEVVADPCGTPTINFDCDTLIDAAYAQDGGATTGVYEPTGATVNGRDVYELDASHRFEYDGAKWVLIRTGADYNAANGTELVPWLADWSLTAVTVTQATIGESCADCEPCLPVTIEVAGTPVDDYAGGTTVDITVSEQGGTVSPLSVTQPTADTIDIKVRWRCTPLSDHITLAGLNPFGNNKRFTGTTGGYKVGANYFDAAGGSTTEALAFPNDIVLDWAESHYDSVVAVSRFLNAPVTNGNNATQLTNIATLNAGTFAGHNDWGRLSKQYAGNFGDQTLGPLAFNFDPINQTSNAGVLGGFYLQELYASAGTQWQTNTSLANMTPVSVATNLSCRISRIYTFAELGI